MPLWGYNNDRNFNGFSLGDLDLPDELVDWFNRFKTTQLAWQETREAMGRDLKLIEALPDTFDNTLCEILSLPMTLHPKGLE